MQPHRTTADSNSSAVARSDCWARLVVTLVFCTLLFLPLALCMRPWMPWGAGHERSEQRSPRGQHGSCTDIRFYGLSTDEVALFVDGERACDWLSDEHAITSVQWLGEEYLRVPVHSNVPIRTDWWHAERIGDVRIDWLIEAPRMDAVRGRR